MPAARLPRWANRYPPRGFAPRSARRYTKPRGSPLLATGTTSAVPLRGVNFARRSGVNIESRLTALHALDDAHRAFETLRDEVTARAAAEDTIPYYAEGHDALLESARTLAAMADLPAHAREAAGEVIAEAEACELRRAEIDALRAEATRLLKERGEMEAALSEVPEDQLVPYTEGADYAAWSARCEAAAERWQAMRDEPDTWNPHLDRLGDGRAALEADLDRLGELRGHDEAWAELCVMHGGIAERARAEGTADVRSAGMERACRQGWGALGAARSSRGGGPGGEGGPRLRPPLPRGRRLPRRRGGARGALGCAAGGGGAR